MNEFLNLKELSNLFGVSQSSLRYHIRQGRITPIRLGRRLLFDRDDVLKELKKGSKRSAVIEIPRNERYASAL